MNLAPGSTDKYGTLGSYWLQVEFRAFIPQGLTSRTCLTLETCSVTNMLMTTFVDFLFSMASLWEKRENSSCWQTCHLLIQVEWLCMDCICTAPPLGIPSRHIRYSITGLPIYFAAGCQETESRLQIETIILNFKAVLKNRL